MDNLLSSSINTIEIWSSSVSPSSMRNKEHHFFHSISRVQEVVVNLDLSNESLMLFCSPFHLKRGLHPQPRVMSLIQPARQSPKKTREYITTHRKIFKRKMTKKTAMLNDCKTSWKVTNSKGQFGLIQEDLPMNIHELDQISRSRYLFFLCM